MKKIWIWFLVLALLSVCGAAFAEADFGYDADYLFIRSYDGTDAELTIPGVIDGSPVWVLDSYVLQENEAIESVVLGEGILQLQDSNFNSNASLANVSLPESLQFIGDSNFYECPVLTEVTVPAGVVYIGGNCFSDCPSLSTVRFTGVCPAFGYGCFGWNDQTVTAYVPDDQFDAYRAALPEEVDVQPSGENAIIRDYVSPEENFEFDAASGTITAYIGYETLVAVPAEIGGTAVQAIGDDCFPNSEYVCCIALPEGVTRIGADAFSDMSCLVHVNLPEGLKEIGANAFRNFRGNAIRLPDSVEIIGENAFQNAWLSCELRLPESLRTLGAGAFESTAVLGELYVPEGLTAIPENAFQYTSVDSLYLPADIESIGAGAFAGSSISYICCDGRDLPAIDPSAFDDCWIYDVDLNWQASKAQMESAQAFYDGIGQEETRVWRMQNPNVDYIYDGYDRYENGVMLGYDGGQTHIRPWDTYDEITVTALGDGAFRDNSVIEYFAVPYNDAFTTIGDEAFAGSKVKTIDLFDSVTTIGAGAFRDCTELTQITIPASVTSIAADAFEGCTGLQEICFLCDPAILTEGMLDSCTNLESWNAGPDASEDAQRTLRLALFGKPEIIITRQPESVELPEGEIAYISVAASGEALSYQWYLMPGDDVNYYPVDGCTGDTYSVIVNSESEWSSVYCEITDAYGTTVASESAAIFIAEPPMAAPEAVGAEGEPFLGSWTAQEIDLGGTVMNAADFGMAMELTLHADGTVDIFDGESMETGVWTVSGGVADVMGSTLTITDDSRLCMEDAGLKMYFISSGEAPAADKPVSEEEQMLALLALMAAMEGDEPSADSSAGDNAYADWLNQKYIAQSFTTEGFTLDAASLGAEYALFFREDGTMDFTLAGMQLANLGWSLEQITIDGIETDAFVIDYYGTLFNAVPTETGFDLDYYGSMILHYVPAE